MPIRWRYTKGHEGPCIYCDVTMSQSDGSGKVGTTEVVIITLAAATFVSLWILIFCKICPFCLLNKRNRRSDSTAEYERIDKTNIDLSQLKQKRKGEKRPLSDHSATYGTDSTRQLSPDRGSYVSTDSWESFDGEMQSLAGGDAFRGELKLSIRQSQTDQRLVLCIHGCQAVPAHIADHMLGVFCRVNMLHASGHDDDSHDRHVVYMAQTSMSSKTRAPEFHEEFTLPLTQTECSGRFLKVSLCGHDRFNQVDVIGETEIDLAHLDLRSGGTLISSFTEVPKKNLGEVELSLCYLPTAEKLTLVLKRARNLNLPAQPKDTDSLVARISVQEKGKTYMRKRSPRYPVASDPVFPEDSFSFDIPRSMIGQLTLSVLLVLTPEAHKREKHVIIGRAVIGYHVGSQGHRHWQTMLDNLRNPVLQWHFLK